MSNDVGQPGNEISPASEVIIEARLPEVNIKEWVVDIEARLPPPTTRPPTRPPNEKIPSIFGNWKCFNDHFPNVPFLPETNMWRFVAYMKNYNLNVQSCLENLQEKKDELWSYYEGVDKQFRDENGQRFIEYLLANSCFLIFALVILSRRTEVFVNFHESAENDDSKMRTFNEFKNLEKLIRGKRWGIWRYMLTMDYQIPWFVVEAVYTKHSNISSKLNTPIHELVMSTFDIIYPRVPKSKLHNYSITVPEDGFQHLLHIFHWSRTPQGKFHETHPFADMRSVDIPSATDLQLRATVFDKDYTTGFDVTFYERRLSGVVQFPPMHRFLYENEIFKDLLAFERGYGIVCGFSVTSYLTCIVSLVKTEEDVGLLRVNGLLPTEKMDLFISSLKEYQTILLSNNIPITWHLFDMMEELRSHYYKRFSIKKCYADFKRRYCSNPWITLSVVGGILLFILTIIQTELSFIQTKYSVLSYKNP
ncbi:uncharacterized protein LOC144555255 [Carex rostrata]